MLESSITPAFTMFTAQFYRKKEQGTRTGIWFSFNGLGGVLGAFIAYGLSQADEKEQLALPGWQVIFLLLGAITVALGAALFLVMPDSLHKARFLTESEVEIAAWRLIKNRQTHTKKFHASHAWEAVRDYQVRHECIWSELHTLTLHYLDMASSALHNLCNHSKRCNHKFRFHHYQGAWLHNRKRAIAPSSCQLHRCNEYLPHALSG